MDVYDDRATTSERQTARIACLHNTLLRKVLNQEKKKKWEMGSNRRDKIWAKKMWAERRMNDENICVLNSHWIETSLERRAIGALISISEAQRHSTEDYKHLLLSFWWHSLTEALFTRNLKILQDKRRHTRRVDSRQHMMNVNVDVLSCWRYMKNLASLTDFT